MTNRYFYQSDIATFLSEDTNTIFGQMSHADEMDTASTQKFAWEQEVIAQTKASGTKSICFVTDVPGAGKTLVGLNVAVQQEADQDLAVYLSGNGPLVQVLTEALTRDKQAQEKAKGNKITKKEAEREVKRFIQLPTMAHMNI